MARSGLTLKLGRGGWRKGPATNPLVIQDAIVSVIAAPCMKAEGVLVAKMLGRGWVHRGLSTMADRVESKLG